MLDFALGFILDVGTLMALAAVTAAVVFATAWIFADRDRARHAAGRTLVWGCVGWGVASVALFAVQAAGVLGVGWLLLSAVVMLATAGLAAAIAEAAVRGLRGLRKP